MCGISGIVSGEKKIVDTDISAMTMALTHRGPDVRKFMIHDRGHAALGHTRLSVIDLSPEANQPMHSADGRFVIVFNGEIYNYEILRQELLRADPEINFRTRSDTEVILEGFARSGADFCRKLEGMFAFTILDQRHETLFLCRDRVGKKPLFYYAGEKFFAFASEIKALRQHPQIRADRSVNYDAIHGFLHLGYIAEPHTAYTRIFKFPAGHYGVLDGSFVLRTVPYWRAEDLPGRGVDSNGSGGLGRLRATLEHAVEKRLVADVPLGAFLSGGTDSSLVTAIAAKARGRQALKTFSIGFSEDKFDESRFAAKVASTLGTDHTAYVLGETEAVEMLEDYLRHFDEPFADTSAIPTMLVSKLARREVTVALTGDGGDELFLGYGSYDWANRFEQLWLRLLQTPLSWAMKKAGNSRMKRVGFLLEKVREDELRSHIFSQEQYFFTLREIRQIATGLTAAPEQLGYLDAHVRFSGAERQAFYDLQHYLKDDLLVKVDRASMYYGLECRCPFLDADLIALALNLPADMKIRDGDHKWALKQLLKEYLPDELIYRPKWGFSIPLARWLKNELAFLIPRYLNEKLVNDIGIVKYSGVQDLLKAFGQGDDYLYHRIWVLIVVHKWLQENG